MTFIRIGDRVIHLDLVTQIREGRNEETLYGQSVRKGVDRFWIEVHFGSGEPLKFEGEAGRALLRHLESDFGMTDIRAEVRSNG